MEQSKNTPNAHAGSTRTPATANIVDTAVTAGNFTILTAGLKAAGLVATLSGKGPFTVFAPTDAALDTLLKDVAKLKAVLSYHVVAKHVDAKDMKSGEVMTVQGTSLTAVVDANGVHVNGAKVVQADIEATNGVIHVIDAVIVPKNWQLLATAA
jgi:uncharacterized surface protein with fasciclin (FAS1) repeats